VRADVGDGVPNLGLPARTLLPILEALRDVVEDVLDALSGVELRMVGASLLIVYEADADRAEEGMRWVEERMKIADEEPVEGEGDDEGGDEEDEDEEDGKSPPFCAKLIDFAHTRLKPCEGPDEGVLLGLETTLGLLEGRIKEVSALVEGQEAAQRFVSAQKNTALYR
jgi:1D-myo-inositol-tetrakisphosphate 5-kinase/inositol-polyphosphate multikinase